MTSRTERYLIANLTRGTFDGVYGVKPPATFPHLFAQTRARRRHRPRPTDGLPRRAVRHIRPLQGPLDERAARANGVRFWKMASLGVLSMSQDVAVSEYTNSSRLRLGPHISVDGLPTSAFFV